MPVPSDWEDADSASQPQSQSHSQKRPPLSSRESDSYSDTNTASTVSQHHGQQQQQQRPKQSHHHHKPNLGRVHARVSSTKALHKHAASSSKANRRPTSPTEADALQRPAHRRAISDYKPQRQPTSSNLQKSASHTSLKPNRSSIDISKRTKSVDKLKRTASGTGIHKTGKSTVHFDLGNDDEEDDQDEWVDASGSNSPYLSRKGSLNSSAQSSLRPGPHSNANSRPDTPNEPKESQVPPSERERVHQKEYLTSRLLQRTPSQGAPPQMTTDMAQATPLQLSPTSTAPNTPPQPASNPDELVSRFVDVPGSGVASEGSFYHSGAASSHRSDIAPRRPHSTTNFSRSNGSADGVREDDGSALAPKTARRAAPPAAQTSRTQQKLNLQRASSVIEPGQTSGGAGGAPGANPLIGVGGPGYDGGNSRDPRISKLLERTGMEYLVVRRYQTPVARSLNRLARRPGQDKSRRIPRPNTGIANGKRAADLSGRHVRNVSMPNPQQVGSQKRTVNTIQSNGAGSSYDGAEVSRLAERLSGTSLVGGEEDDGVASLLRNLWDKPLDLSASTD